MGYCFYAMASSLLREPSSEGEVVKDGREDPVRLGIRGAAAIEAANTFSQLSRIAWVVSKCLMACITLVALVALCIRVVGNPSILMYPAYTCSFVLYYAGKVHPYIFSHSWALVTELYRVLSRHDDMEYDWANAGNFIRSHARGLAVEVVVAGLLSLLGYWAYRFLRNVMTTSRLPCVQRMRREEGISDSPPVSQTALPPTRQEVAQAGSVRLASTASPGVVTMLPRIHAQMTDLSKVMYAQALVLKTPNLGTDKSTVMVCTMHGLIAMRGQELSLRTLDSASGTFLVMDFVPEQWRVLAFSKRQDFAILLAPRNVWSQLHVKALKIGRKVTRTFVQIMTYGSRGEALRAYGHTEKAVKQPLIFHHRCSTIPGDSGAAIIDKGCVVGMHLGAASLEEGAPNYAVDLTWLRQGPRPESSEDGMDDIVESEGHSVYTSAADREHYEELERGFQLKERDPFPYSDKFLEWEDEDYDDDKYDDAEELCLKMARQRKERLDWSEEVNNPASSPSRPILGTDTKQEDVKQQLRTFLSEHVSTPMRGLASGFADVPGASQDPPRAAPPAVRRLLELASYKFDRGILRSRGQVVLKVGTTHLRGLQREAKAVSVNMPEVEKATGLDLSQYVYPPKTALAVETSLWSQIQRRQNTHRTATIPSTNLLKKVTQEAHRVYPSTKVPAWCGSGEIDQKLLRQAVKDHVLGDGLGGGKINRKANPGVPWNALGSTHGTMSNGEVIDDHYELLEDVVVARMLMHASGQHPALRCEECKNNRECKRIHAVEAILEGYQDPIRLFIKGEPHTQAKQKSGRWRLIGNLSIDEQIRQQLLSNDQNKAEIKNFRSIPSQSGMGLTDEYFDILLSQLRMMFPGESLEAIFSKLWSTDLSGFDWTAREWELLWEWRTRLRLKGVGTKSLYGRITRSHMCIHQDPVFFLPNGDLVLACLDEDGKPEMLVISGGANTAATNSRMRWMLVWLVQYSLALERQENKARTDSKRRLVTTDLAAYDREPETTETTEISETTSESKTEKKSKKGQNLKDPVAAGVRACAVTMGDDCIENTEATAVQLKREYQKLGHILRDANQRPDFVDFCSHKFTADTFYPLNPAKQVFAFIHKQCDELTDAQAFFSLAYNLRHHPRGEAILRGLEKAIALPVPVDCVLGILNEKIQSAYNKDAAKETR